MWLMWYACRRRLVLSNMSTRSWPTRGIFLGLRFRVGPVLLESYSTLNCRTSPVHKRQLSPILVYQPTLWVISDCYHLRRRSCRPPLPTNHPLKRLPCIVDQKNGLLNKKEEWYRETRKCQGWAGVPWRKKYPVMWLKY